MMILTDPQKAWRLRFCSFGWMQSQKPGGLWKILAAVGAVLLGGIGLLVMRRRRADEEFEISMLSIEGSSFSHNTTEHHADAESLSASGSPEVQSVAERGDKETSFLTVYSDSDAVVQADEVDPVAEADVYIAYGRDEQAEEVLLDGIASQPERMDIHIKLLTLYHKTGNASGFERTAEELYSRRDELSTEAWAEIAEMGQSIAPENPLFSLSADQFEMANLEASSEISTSEIVETPVEAEAPAAASEAPASNDVDDNSAISSNTEMVVEALSNDESIQLINFDDGRSEMSELDEVEIDILDAAEDSEIQMIEDDAPVVSEQAEIEEDMQSLDDDVLEFPSSEAKAEPVATASTDDDDSEDKKVSEVQEVSDLEIDPEYDEARTQYELAKVFVDLGDDDGARRILNELVANDDNDSTLRNEAKDLLETIT